MFLDNDDAPSAKILIDQLESTLNKNDDDNVEFLIQKSRFFEITNNLNLAEEICLQAIETAKLDNNNLGLARAYCQLAYTKYLRRENSPELENKERNEILLEVEHLVNQASDLLDFYKKANIKDRLFLITQVLVLDYKGIIEMSRDSLSKAISFYKQASDISNKIGYDYITIATLNNLAFAYFLSGEPDLAQDLMEQKILICKQTGNQKELSLAYSFKGEVYRKSGNFDKALEFNNLVIDIGKSSKKPNFIISGMVSIAFIYIDMGEYEMAKSYFNKAANLLKEHFGSVGKYLIFFTNYIQGVMARNEMDYDLSLQYFQISIKNLVGGEHVKVPILFELILTVIDHKESKKEEAMEYLDEIKKINEKYPDYRDNLDIYKLSKALILNKSTRIENKFEAKELFLDLEKNTQKSKFQLMSLQGLIDILLYELKASGDSSILQDIKDEIEKIVLISSSQKQFIMVLNAFILKSRVELSEGKYDLAFKSIEQAEQLCKEKNLATYKKRIEIEKQKLSDQVTVFKEQIKNNPSIINKIEYIQLENYFNNAKKIVADSIDEKTTNNSIINQ